MRHTIGAAVTAVTPLRHSSMLAFYGPKKNRAEIHRRNGICAYVCGYVFVYPKTADEANDIRLQQHTFASIYYMYTHTKHRQQYIQFNTTYLPFGCFFPCFLFVCLVLSDRCEKVCVRQSNRPRKKSTTTKYDGRNKMQTWKCTSKTTANTTKANSLTHSHKHTRSNGVTDLI